MTEQHGFVNQIGKGEDVRPTTDRTTCLAFRFTNSKTTALPIPSRRYYKAEFGGSVFIRGKLHVGVYDQLQRVDIQGRKFKS